MKLQLFVRIIVRFLALTLTLSCIHSSKQNTQPSDSTLTPTTAVPAAAAAASAVTPVAPTPNESAIQPRGLDYGATIKLIAFGSSANQNLPQPIWSTILSLNPDIFLFMGDTIQTSKPEQKPIFQQFRKLNRIPEYRAFREKIPFLATWDDQDYGLDNGGLENENKELSKKDFLRNWTYIRDSISMGQAGIYHAKIIGPKKKQVQFIMLDTRTFRSPLNKDTDATTGVTKIVPNKDTHATVLGPEQWAWLEEQLKRPAQLRFVVTSIPLIASEPGAEQITETWSNFPNERQRFFELLKKQQIQNVIVLSGNSHQGGIAKLSIKDWGPLFDVTSSPINEPASSPTQDSSYVAPASNIENFGLAEIDWLARKVHIQLRNKNNGILSNAEYKIQ